MNLIRGMAVPLSIAAAVGAVIAGLAPRNLLVAVAGPDNPLAVPVAAIIGTPLYMSGEAFLPLWTVIVEQFRRPAESGVGRHFAHIIGGDARPA